MGDRNIGKRYMMQKYRWQKSRRWMDGWTMDREADTRVDRKIEYIKKEMWVSGWMGDGKTHG